MRLGPSNHNRRTIGYAMRFARSMVFAALITILLFMVLPLMQHIGSTPASNLTLREVSTTVLPPPPPPRPEAPPEKSAREEPPPELEETVPPLDMKPLELALRPGFGEGLYGDFAVRLPRAAAAPGEEADAIFSLPELDQKPRILYQPAPDYPAELRRRRVQGKVYVVFVVDRGGRTAEPVIEASTHPAFDQPALHAVKRWRFEPGKRDGKPVRFMMRVPITFTSG